MSHIPVEFIQMGFKTHRQRLVKFVIQLKIMEGFRIRKHLYSRELLILTAQAGFITKCRKTNQYYQRSWRTLTKGYKSVTYVDIEHDLWERTSFQNIAYLAAMAYLICLQEKRKPNGSPKAGKKTLKLSAHFGGVSHSLVSEFFGKKSKAWSFLRRRSCEKDKLLRFKRRHDPEPAYQRVPGWDDPHLHGCFNVHNGVAREITSFVWFKVPVNLMVPSWVRKERVKGAS